MSAAMRAAGLPRLACAGVLALGCGMTATPADDTGGDSDATTSSSTGPGTTSSDATSASTTLDPSTTDMPGDTSGDTSVTDPCITDLGAGHHAFECEGLVYDVEVPEACVSESCGMIVDVHGYTMSGQMQDANTDMRALGREFGFIVVQPNANPAPPASSWTAEIDDPLVFDFMQRVAAAWAVDPDRWHFTGFSQGGYMSWRFICDHADVLASVAPAAACGEGGLFPDCSFVGDQVPSEPLDILYLHGTTDALVGFECAQPRVDAVVQHFGLGPAEMLTQDDDHARVRHTGEGMVLEFIQHDYTAASSILGGHCYPGSDDAGDAPGQLFPFRCEQPSALVWGAEVMQFFRDHPRG